MAGRPHTQLAADYPSFAKKPRTTREVRRRAALIRECWTDHERARRLVGKRYDRWIPPVVRDPDGFDGE